MVSPVLANLFLHYAFDVWMDRRHADQPFERYADDAVVHCRSHAAAARLAACGLELHPTKTRIVPSARDHLKQGGSTTMCGVGVDLDQRSGAFGGFTV